MPHRARQALPFRPQLFGDDQRIERAAAYMFGSMAEHAGEFAVYARHALVEVEHDDRLRRALEQFIEQRSLHAQLRFCALAAAQMPQHQPDQRYDAEATRGRAHRAVHDLDMPSLEHRGLPHADANRERIAADGLGRVDALLAVPRAFQQRGSFASRGQQVSEQGFFRERSTEFLACRRVTRQQPAALSKQDDLATFAEIDCLVETPEIVQIDPGNSHTLETTAASVDATAQGDRPIRRPFAAKGLRNEQAKFGSLLVGNEKAAAGRSIREAAFRRHRWRVCCRRCRQRTGFRYGESIACDCAGVDELVDRRRVTGSTA